MTWKDPPLLANPDRVREHKGRRLLLYYDGAKLRRVAWRTPRAVYYVSNTLNYKLSNAKMLAIAASLRRAETRRRATLAAGPGYGTLMLLRLVAARCRARPARPRRGLRRRCPGADPCPYAAAGLVGQRAEGVLRFPQASAVGPDGSVYVADQYTHAIQVFGPDGAFRRELGAAGSGPGGLSSVGAVAVAARRRRSTWPTAPTGSTASPPTGRC